MGYYPVFLDLRDRSCVVIGEDAEAREKAKALVEAGARVTVICRDIVDAFAEMAGRGEIALYTRPYQDGDLAGAFLAIAATTHDRQLSEAIHREALQERVLLNVVDITELCTWIYPALVRRGDATIAISTNGRSPAMASFLRREVDRALPSEYAMLVDVLAEVREEIRNVGQRPPSQLWQDALDDDAVRDLLRSGDQRALHVRLREILTDSTSD